LEKLKKNKENGNINATPIFNKIDFAI